MQPLTFYPVFLGALISVVGLTRFAVMRRGGLKTQTLSGLATTDQRIMRQFRNTLLMCGLLFAITMFGFIVPRVAHREFAFAFSLVIIIGEFLVALIPAHKTTILIHDVLAKIMAGGMLALAYVFVFSFLGTAQVAELATAVVMTALSGITLMDRHRRHFVRNELLFIFASHLSIAVAAVALRR